VLFLLNYLISHLSVCVFVMSLCVGSQCVLWQNGWMDPDAVCGDEWGQSRDECIRWVW